MKRNINLLIDFIRFQYYPHMLLTFVFCLSSGLFVSFRHLDAFQSAKVLEMYVGFVGVLLLTPIFLAEQDKEIWQLEQSRKMPMWQLYLIRLTLAVVCIIAVVCIYLVLMKTSDSEVYFQKMWCGGISEMAFLGAIGFFASAITNQVFIGYMASIMYYAINLGGKNYLGKLALFQMAKGEYGFIIWMLPAAILLFVAGIIIREYRA